ncbi:MAG: CPXCG motif-containing cysteine-rich protein [Longimicrobiales bacterium]
MGDGTADTDAGANCPYCGEWVEILLDPGGGADQEYVEDCEVCCRPWRVLLRYDEGGQAHVTLVRLDD